MAARSRRSLLHAVGTGTIVALAGCIATPEATPTTISPSSAPASAPDDEWGPKRCRGTPVTAEQAFVDEPGYEDGIEYDAANRTVRYLVTSRGSQTDTWTFEEWGTIRSATVGLERVREATVERLGHDDFDAGTAGPAAVDALEAPDVVVMLAVTATGDADGEALAARLDALVETAPRSADVTVSLDGDEFQRTVPVYAERYIVRTI